jgi:3-phenylpropionate/trans-cinnamate dioxygenase ferredoxin component
MAEYEKVARTADLGPGSVAEVRAHGRDLMLANVGQTYYAVEARCPLDGTNLARDGRLSGTVITCPNDDASFDVRTGQQLDGDAALSPHPIQVEANEIRVGPPSP